LIKVVGHDLLNELVTFVHSEGETALDPGDNVLEVSSFGAFQHIVQYPREKMFQVAFIAQIIIVTVFKKTKKIVLLLQFGRRRPAMLCMRDHTVVIVLEDVTKEGRVIEEMLIVWFLSIKKFTK
jgi:hypothetical protein